MGVMIQYWLTMCRFFAHFRYLMTLKDQSPSTTVRTKTPTKPYPIGRKIFYVRGKYDK